MSKKKPSRFSSKPKRSTARPARAPSASESLIKIGTHAMQDFISTGAGEAQKTHEKIFAIGRESADKLSRSADSAANGVNEALAIGRDNIEACVECTTLAADMTRSFGAEAMNFANDMMAQNMEISKEAMACRSFSDLFELQSKAVRHTLDQLFNESSRFSDMLFHYASSATKPLNGRLVQATERLSKVIAA